MCGEKGDAMKRQGCGSEGTGGRLFALAVAVTTSACALPFRPVGVGQPFRVIAHRGASGHAPENTLPAFRRALELGAFEVELDVQLSRDDVLVLFHDRTLDRKTDGSGKVREHDAVTLREMEIGSWFDQEHGEVAQRYAGTALTTLRELFAELGDRLYYHIEIKALEEAIPRLVLELVREFRLANRVTITSFSWAQVSRFHTLAPRIPVCLLIDDADDLYEALSSNPDRSEADRPPLQRLQRDLIDRAWRAGFDQVAVAARDLSPEIVAHAHTRGLEIRAWGIKSRADMVRATRLGTNGMTINWPERLLQLIADQRS